MKIFSQIDLKPKISSITHPKIGLIALSTDYTIEQDFRKICYNQNLELYVNRIPFLNPLNRENYLKMTDYLSEIADNILPGEKINSIAYGCTSGTVAIGEKKIIEIGPRKVLSGLIKRISNLFDIISIDKLNDLDNLK